ncbi:MAG: twin-arginine translocation signal domain-containing protein, partial [Sedimentisphaerales bacterium]|nr:twin-arginine translocation signal domain-containing protein [Sedimentisphaerales bacterium]
MKNNEKHLNRRDILKGFGLGAAGLAFGGKYFGPALTHAAPGSPYVNKNGIFSKAGPAKVSLIKGNDCR